MGRVLTLCGAAALLAGCQLLPERPTQRASPKSRRKRRILTATGIPDFDRDGKHELAVQLDSAAYMATVGVFRSDGERSVASASR